MYIFCTEFRILISNIFLNFIIFVKLEEITLRNYLQLQQTQLFFSSDHISLNIIPLEISQCLLESIFYGRKIINIWSFLRYISWFGLSNKTCRAWVGCTFSLISYTCQLIYDPNKFSKTGQRDDYQWPSVKMCEQYNWVIIIIFPIIVLWSKHSFFYNGL